MGLLRDGRREPLSRTFARHRKSVRPPPLPAPAVRQRLRQGMRARRVKTGRRPGFSEAGSPVPKETPKRASPAANASWANVSADAIKDKPGCFDGKIMNQ